MKIYLLRHTKSSSNESNKADSQIDSDLTEEGLDQAKKLVTTLNKYQIDTFIVSPLQRTLKTLQPFLDTISNPKVLVSDLILERDLGKFTGTPIGTFQKYCDDNNFDKVDCRPEGGESIVDVFLRAQAFLLEIKEKYPNETILVCSSKNFLLCLEIAITNNKIQNFYSLKSFELGELREFNY